jgi:uncharacterized protein (DUF488 family)
MPDAIYTIGHSNRSWDVFLTLLTQNRIAQLLDVRKIPRSRFNPHFNDRAMREALTEHGIAYVPMPELGGKRNPTPDSPNTAFRAEGGLQSYADYMATPEFFFALEQLMARAEETPAAIMCAEAKPENCHRQLIADALLLRGHPVMHILGAHEIRAHNLHKAARVDAHGQLTYPAQSDQLSLLE